MKGYVILEKNGMNMVAHHKDTNICFYPTITQCFAQNVPDPAKYLCEIVTGEDMSNSNGKDSPYRTHEFIIVKTTPIAELLKNENFCLKMVNIDGRYLQYINTQTLDGHLLGCHTPEQRGGGFYQRPNDKGAH